MLGPTQKGWAPMTESIELGIPGLSLDMGDHVCAFFRGADERDTLLEAYLGAGLQSGDKCVCVLDGSHGSEARALLDALETRRPSSSEDDQLDVRLSRDTYLRGGRFSTSAMLAFWEETIGSAIAGGYRFSRAVGEMTWALRQMPGVDELVGYEAELNYFLPRYPQVVLCLYDLERFDGEILVDILKTHPLVLVGGMVLENPYYLEPAEFLAARQ
jgi:hypothetical protein